MMFKKLIFFFFLLISFSLFSQKEYVKSYHTNGSIKEEGWLQNNQKTAYWKFYYLNGNLKKQGYFENNKPTKYWYFYFEDGSKKSEGHFIGGTKNKWWVFYIKMDTVSHKCQFKKNKRHGYCLRYEGKKLAKAEKYIDGKKIKEWTSLKSFKKENKLSDLK